MARNKQPLCVIVGAGPLMGAALARAFGKAGYALGLIARDGARLQGLADDLAATGTMVTTEVADATHDTALAAAIHRIESKTGPADVLIVNAFSRHTGLPRDLTPQQALQAVHDNLLPGITSVQAVLPAMRERGQGVILISGGKSAIDCPVQLAPLGLGKAAMRNYALTLACDVADQGIRVAHVMICDHIRPGTDFDPDVIAAFYLEFAADATRDESEIVFDGANRPKKKQS